MTPRTTAQPQMSTEEFEELARRAPELEFIHGRVQVKPVPNGNHAEIVTWLQKLCMQHRPDLWLYPGQGIAIETYREGRARPDGVLAPDEHFAGAGEWAAPTGVLMTVEVTSRDADTNRRDRVEKPDGYAAVGIPVYLLVDREACSVTVFTEPEKGTYRSATTRPFGAVVELPGPVGFALDTEKLKEYAD
ncbi:Uma2 family endonuclease [Streptomyces sp. NPDC088719]|uniref:Uma2 family endonuclease n=1 Tax=Streptomyces sp. NPDC088719 TaxID=3365872 RepID=UPI00380C4E80